MNMHSSSHGVHILLLILIETQCIQNQAAASQVAREGGTRVLSSMISDRYLKLSDMQREARSTRLAKDAPCPAATRYSVEGDFRGEASRGVLHATARDDGSTRIRRESAYIHPLSE